MADVRIDDAVEDTEVTGVENLPESDAGVGKRVSISKIKDYIVAQVTNAETIASIDSASDGVYVRHNNLLKRVSFGVFGDAVMAAAFAKAGIVQPNGNEILAISDVGTEKTINLSAVREFVLADVSSVFSSATAADAMAATDCFVVKQGSTVKKATALQIATYVEGRIGAYVNALSDVGTLASTDKLLVSVNGVARSATVASIVSLVQGGYVGGPATTTENKVPQWDATTKTLKDGLALRTTVRASGTAANDGIPTEAAVRAAVEAVEVGITVSGTTPTVGNIPVWASADAIATGKSIQTTVRSELLSSDGAIPTEKAVRTAIESSVSGKVDKVDGKGLSTNDYTTAEKTKLAGVATGADVSPITAVKVNGTALTPVSKAVNIDLTGKVDKVDGKGLSTNDYTTAEKTKLAGIEVGADVNVQADWNVTDVTSDAYIANKPTIPAASKIADWSSSTTYAVGDYCLYGGFLRRCIVAGRVSSFRISDWEYVPAYPNDSTKFLRGDGTWASMDLSSKVDKVDGKGLSTNDYTTAEKTKLAGIDMATKVDKVDGKGLSTNDYTTAEKNKLAGVATGADVSPITAVKVNGTALTPVSKAVNIDLSGKVDKVDGKGLSTNDYTTVEKNKLAGVATGADVSPITTVKVNGTALTPVSKAVNIDLTGKVDKVDGKGLSTNDYTTAEKTKLAGIDMSAKVDKETGKGLSTNDYTTAEKTKLAGIATGADVSKIADWVSGKNYAVGDYCLRGGFLRRCIHAGSTQSFNAADWEHIPQYPTSGGSTKYLRGDGTWQTPPSTTNFTGATSEAAGSAGLVPAPLVSERNKFLKGDGTWSDNPMGDVFGPATTTENKVPQWDATTKTLKDGLGVLTDETTYDVEDVGKLMTFAATVTMMQKASVGKPSTVVTADNIPAWNATTATLDDYVSLDNGYAVIKSSDLANRSTTSDSAILTEKAVYEIAAGAEGMVTTDVTPTAGAIPLWKTPASGAAQTKELTAGMAVRTSTGGNENTTDTEIPTVKWSENYTDSTVELWSVADIQEASTPEADEQLWTLTNHTFNIEVGGNYTFLLPDVNDITSLARDFRIAFRITKPDGASGSTASVTFSGTGTVISTAGVGNTITIPYNATPPATESHFYHFYETTNYIVCVKEL